MASPTVTVLDSFDPNSLSDGLVADASGSLIGTTLSGGAKSDGTVFVLAKSGSSYSSPVPVATFNGADGMYPRGGLIIDDAGNLYGTALRGGANNNAGTVFKVEKLGSSYNQTPIALLNFDGVNGGATPFGGLIEDKNGNLFGTTVYGGTSGYGTVFGVSTTSNLIFSVSFNGSNGAYPSGSLVSDKYGDLFGTTLGNGTNIPGTVFELVKSSNSGYSGPATIATFNGLSGTGLNPNSLIIDASGNLFGTTASGGASGDGTVFEMTKSDVGYNKPVSLASFNGSNGIDPHGLIMDAAGNLFGTTGYGTGNYGTVFELQNTGYGYSSTAVPIVKFDVTNGNGVYPNAGLIADAAGDLFGTTSGSSFSKIGSTVFEIKNSGFVTGSGSSPVPSPSSNVHANDLTYSSTASGANHFIDLVNFEASYSDLISVFGTNQGAMQNWYNTVEPSENRVETFDGLDYVASYGDLIKAFGGAGSAKAVQDDGASHFISYGQNEGRSTSFNGLDYIASYGDLINAFGANNDLGAYHYIEYGNKEGRSVSFDGLAYIANSPDLMNAFGANEQAGAAHYIDFGNKEGRKTTFDVAGYESNHPDLVGKYASNDAFLTDYINTYKTTGHYLT